MTPPPQSERPLPPLPPFFFVGNSPTRPFVSTHFSWQHRFDENDERCDSVLYDNLNGKSPISKKLLLPQSIMILKQRVCFSFLSKSIILNSRVSFLFFTLTDLEICRVAPREVTGTYTFDFPSSKGYRYSDALTHSRAKLMEEMSKLGYNFLIMEGSVPSFFSLPSSKTLNGSCFKLKFRWSITTMRKSKAERIEVRYHAQPAVARGWQRPRTPPYLQLLESH